MHQSHSSFGEFDAKLKQESHDGSEREVDDSEGEGENNDGNDGNDGESVFEMVDYTVAGDVERVAHVLEEALLGLSHMTMSERVSEQHRRTNCAGRVVVSVGARRASVTSILLGSSYNRDELLHSEILRWAGFVNSNHYSNSSKPNPHNSDCGVFLPNLAVLVITPVSEGNTPTSFDWDSEKLLMSAAQLALRGSTSTLTAAIFVATSSAWRRLYSGLMLSPGVSSSEISNSNFFVPVYSGPQISSHAESPDANLKFLLNRYALESKSVFTRFRMIHSAFIPSHHSNLLGLKNLFLERLRSGFLPPEKIDIINVSATATFSYFLDFSVSKSIGYYYDPLRIISHHISGQVPVGSNTDPILSVCLESFFNESICSDYLNNGTDLRNSAENSSVWTLTCFKQKHDTFGHGYLYNTMSNILQTWIDLPSSQKSSSIFSPEKQYAHFSPFESADISDQKQIKNNEFSDSATNRLHNSRPRANSSVTYQTGSKIPQSSLITRIAAAAASTIQDSVAATNPNLIPNINQFQFNANTLPEHIFSNASANSKYPDPGTFTLDPKIPRKDPESSLRTISAIARAKFPACAAFDSPLWRLCSHILSLISTQQHQQQSHYGQTTNSITISKLWPAFVRELRARWDLCGLDTESTLKKSYVEDFGVDLRDGILGQKIAMLGYCMKRKRQAAAMARKQQKTQDATVTIDPSSKTMAGSFDVEVVDAVGQHSGNNGLAEEEESLLSIGARFLNGVMNSAVGEDGVIGKNGWYETEEKSIPIVMNGSGSQAHSSKFNGNQYEQRKRQSYPYGESWNSDKSWEDFSPPLGSLDAKGSGFNHKSSDIDADDLVTNEYSVDVDEASVDNEDTDLFFDSLDFQDIPKIPTTIRVSKKSSLPHRPPQSDFKSFHIISPTKQQNGELLKSKSVGDTNDQQNSTSVLSDDSSGFIVGSISPAVTIPTTLEDEKKKRRVSSLAGDSFVKLPLDIFLSRESDDDKYTAVEIGDPDVAEGALRPVELGLKIFATGALMMVPEVQENGVMTEDMIADHERVLLALGTSKEATTIRAKMQTGQLKSDMESFKAANPRASLEDFVRWHSPRDWEINDSAPNGGKLSARMMDPGNLWQELWLAARRIPASRQKPLFEYEKEGEKVFLFLEDLTMNGIDDLFFHLLPTLFFVAYDAIVSNPLVSQIPTLSKQVLPLTNQIICLNWGYPDGLAASLSKFVEYLNYLEYLIGFSQSVLYKLPMQLSLVDRVLSQLNDEKTVSCEIRGILEREAVCDLLNDEGIFLDVPNKKEFVLITAVPYPTSDSRILQQRMYALLKEGEFRVLESIAYDES
ncbi:Rab3 GTPase-activating protein catalytic subunit [Physocladia obscura]|uniref:Rab3 GTPase-activating protein catalytic subunit n=1 Tax=Physocladia obscura TaxID=109957 RepID=A0AAD5T275_9FUNG|nr:Rab3 GTPase-activating protein catalytic subunit [Physocladia obscura]